MVYTLLKWMTPYARRLVRKMIRTGKKEHKGYRYLVVFDEETKLIFVVDKRLKRRHILLMG